MKLNAFVQVYVFLLFGMLGGCASLPQERGITEVHALVEQRAGGTLTWATDSAGEANIDSLVDRLLQQPLTADSAVQIALLRNPRMQMEYARLGVAQADIYAASRVSNPTFSITLLNEHRAGESKKIDASITQSFADVLLWPARRRIAAGEYERMQQSISATIFTLTADVRAAWYDYVGAEQIAAMRKAVFETAQISAELAGKFHAAGNISALQLKLEQAAATQARLQSTRANAETKRARLALSQLLGLSMDVAQWRALNRLPAPVAVEDDAEKLKLLAHEQRLDLAAAKKKVTLLEQNVNTAKQYRLLGHFDAGIAMERETDHTHVYGPSLSLQLPIFNQGQAAIARANALFDEGRAQLRALELEIDNTVLMSIEQTKVARSIVDDYRTALIPQREAVVKHTQENVNFMLVGIFELLLAKQQEYDAYQSYLEAVRDYWLARVDLMRAVGAHLPGDGDSAGEWTIGPDEIINPASDKNIPHEHHDTHEHYGDKS